ncbi:efflux RND transporter periplasmic adaptor subunit [Candidatus Zixiibacteriota bacterium]
MDRPIKKKTFTPRRIAGGAGAAIFLVVIIYGLLSIGGGSTYRVDSAKLTISAVSHGEFQEFIPVSGTVMPLKTFYLDATEGGRVLEIFREEGSFVNAGDSILRLDNTDLQLDIMYREAQLFEQINNLRNTRLAIEQNSLTIRGQLLEIDYRLSKADRDHEQGIDLKERNLISQNEYARLRDDFDYWSRKRELTLESWQQDSTLRTIQLGQLEVSVERMQANLEVVKQKLNNLIIRAPIGGQLTALNAEIGQSKAPRQHLGQIDWLEGFKIRAAVDEYYIARVGVGQTGSVTISGVTYPLTIKKVYPEVQNGRFQIDLEFSADEPPGIRRGQSVQIRLVLGDLTEAILLARGAFYQETGGNWIFVVDESEDFAVKRSIRIGMQNTQVYEVLEGLEPGEKAITSSYEALKDFDRIVFKDR